MAEKKRLSKKRSCTDTGCRRFKQIDIYGKEVGIYFQGEDTYKSCVGALLTLVSLTLIVAYSGAQLLIIIQRKSHTISQLEIFKNAEDLSEVKQASDYKLSFAYVFEDVTTGAYYDLEPTIGSVQLIQNNYNYKNKSDTSFIDIEPHPCRIAQGDFESLSHEDWGYYDINQMSCANTSQIMLSGDQYSKSVEQYFEILIQRCEDSDLDDQPDKVICASDEKFQEFLQTKRLIVAMPFSFMDFQDYSDQPIKTALQFVVNKRLAQITDHQLVELVANKATFSSKSSWFIRNTLEENFINPGETRINFLDEFEQTNQEFGVKFSLTNRQIQVDRKVYTILDLIADTGGLIDGLMILAGILLFIFSANLFKGDIVQGVFRVRETDAPARQIRYEQQSLEGDVRKRYHKKESQIYVHQMEPNKVSKVLDDPEIDVDALSLDSQVIDHQTGKKKGPDSILINKVMNLEMFKLNRQDLTNMFNHLRTQKPFNFSVFDTIIANICCYSEKQKWRSTQQRNFLKRGTKKIQQALDVRQIVKDHLLLSSMINLTLNHKQRTLLKMQRKLALEDLTSSESGSDRFRQLYPEERINNINHHLTDMKIQGNLDKKLVYGVVERNPHRTYDTKGFESVKFLKDRMSFISNIKPPIVDKTAISIATKHLHQVDHNNSAQITNAYDDHNNSRLNLQHDDGIQYQHSDESGDTGKGNMTVQKSARETYKELRYKKKVDLYNNPDQQQQSKNQTAATRVDASGDLLNVSSGKPVQKQATHRVKSDAFFNTKDPNYLNTMRKGVQGQL